MRAWPILLELGACNQVLGVHDFTADAVTDTMTDGTFLPECTAQRLVHLVGGNGGLAWFTIAWPAPTVIESYMPTYAYDDPTLAVNVGVETAHPLYARRIDQRGLWVERGTHPQPSVFVAGTTQAHTDLPTTNTVSGGVSIDAMAASLQRSLQPMLPAIVIGGMAFGAAPSAPVPVAVATATDAPGAFAPTLQPQLRPTASQLARYLPHGGTTLETELAMGLAFAANGFEAGAVTTVVMPAYRDDPHMAFATPGFVTTTGNNLAAMLDAFYADLQTRNESTCGHAGAPLSLADNVVVVVSGDTPKSSFNSNGWGDGPPGNVNLLYVRGNGFIRPGWFGAIDASSRTNFDPSTGALSAATPNDVSTAAAWAGMLYAIARGDRSVVTAITNATYDGVIATP